MHYELQFKILDTLIKKEHIADLNRRLLVIEMEK